MERNLNKSRSSKDFEERRCQIIHPATPANSCNRAIYLRTRLYWKRPLASQLAYRFAGTEFSAVFRLFPASGKQRMGLCFALGLSYGSRSFSPRVTMKSRRVVLNAVQAGCKRRRPVVISGARCRTLARL